MIKKIFSILGPIWLGSFITNILERIMNVWLARGIGILVAVIMVLILYYFWMKPTNN